MQVRIDKPACLHLCVVARTQTESPTLHSRISDNASAFESHPSTYGYGVINLGWAGHRDQMNAWPTTCVLARKRMLSARRYAAAQNWAHVSPVQLTLGRSRGQPLWVNADTFTLDATNQVPSSLVQRDPTQRPHMQTRLEGVCMPPSL
jgi:hypothetical protein